MATAAQSDAMEWDVVVVGAGISGINAGYRLQTEMKDCKYTILESRGGIGGTWDFFKYPGLRSDSDLHTFGFPWRPWTEQKAIADGESIVNYIKDTARSEGIDDHVQFNHKVKAFNWSSETQQWALDVNNNGKAKRVFAKYIILASGYYDYENALPASIPGLNSFKGTIVHPQWWPQDLDYTGKKVIIIGSGATSITLLPILADKAEKVTMLQRSPGYVIAMPQQNKLGNFFRSFLPKWMVYKLVRWQFLVIPYLFFNFCRAFPNAARKALQKRTTELLPKNVPHDPHFKPSYNPWEQRLCVAPDGDIFKSLHEGKAEIYTGHIETVNDKGIKIKDTGDQLDADIIVTATGLKMQMAGGADITVDKQPVEIGDKFLWHGMMLQDVPNCAFVIGYTNASWTLGADATAIGVCRLLNDMKRKGATSATPYMEPDYKLEERPVLNLNSTYVKKAEKSLPRAGDRGPWRPRTSYFSDYWAAKYGNQTEGLKLTTIKSD